MSNLSELARKKLKANIGSIGLLMKVLSKGERTISNWIENDHPMLTTPAALKVISEETGLPVNQILSEELRTATA